MVWHSTAMDTTATNRHQQQHSHSSHHSRKRARLSHPSTSSSRQHPTAAGTAGTQPGWTTTHHSHHHHHHHQARARHTRPANQSSTTNTCSTALTMSAPSSFSPSPSLSPSVTSVNAAATVSPLMSSHSMPSSYSSMSTAATEAASAPPSEPAATPAPVAREIPGFYYDPEKKRYFKITANHVHGSQHPHSAQSIKEKMAVKPKLDPIVRPKQISAPAKPSSYSTMTRLLSDRSLGHLKNQSHQLADMHSLLVRRWKRDRHQEPTLISFQTTYSHIAQHPTRNDLFLGTPKGELWQYHFTDQTTATLSRHARATSDWCYRRNNVDYSEMTSLHILPEDLLISTYLGNLDRAGMIRVQKDTKDPSTDLTTVMTYSPKRSNVWTSAHHGHRIAIGIDKQLGILSDDWLRDGSTPKLQTYWTGSDVFSVALEPSFVDTKPEIVYAGCRNGLVKVFDLRQPAPQQPKFSDRSPQFRHHYRMNGGMGGGGGSGYGRGPDFMNATRDQEGSILRGMGHEGSSVHCLQRIGAFYLLTMAMNGEMSLWDTRFIGPNSVDFFSNSAEDNNPVLAPRRPSFDANTNTAATNATASTTTTKSGPMCKLRTAIPDQLSKVGFCVNADQTLVAALNLENTVSFWSIRTGQRVHDLKLPSNEQVTQLRFSNDLTTTASRSGIWVAVPNQVQWWGCPLPA